MKDIHTPSGIPISNFLQGFIMNLNVLGWSGYFQEAFEKLDQDSLVPGRVVRHNKNQYIIHDGQQSYQATLLGRLLYEQDDSSSLPAVGDWVCIQTFDGDQAVIHHVLPRFGAFFRKEAGHVTRKQVIAANIDIAFLVSGLDKDFNVRRIERYLVQVRSSGAKPFILLNKTDLRDDIDQLVMNVTQIAGDVEVIPVSVVDGTGFDRIRSLLKEGITIAFLGSSGVGKSSIANVLADSELQRVGTVREDDSRGRHTTSYRELIPLASGGVIIDTPGLRELQLWGDEDDLQAVFSEIDLLSVECKFRDCQHVEEPGCAVLQAVEEGELDNSRFESYKKLRKELMYLQQRQDEAAFLQAKKREKRFGKMLKEINRHNPKR